MYLGTYCVSTEVTLYSKVDEYLIRKFDNIGTISFFVIRFTYLAANPILIFGHFSLYCVTCVFHKY